ncbi:polysaccharide biosynthesis/export family protein [Bradyrhizobium sp. HKCCYLS2038]|uniref:polysaccharide biosynthesis/export family protein n=1 Tax=unclassified Bradyrhizobium TaxID=2631580 RepID=UPI003EC134BD
MRTRLAQAAAIAAIVTITSSPLGPVRGQALSAAASVRAEPAPEPSPSHGPTIGVDDKLKISFFESVELGSRKADERVPPMSTLRTFYQRMDLSGEYLVDQDGSIAIPLLGKFRLAGRTLDDVRNDLIATFATTFTTRTADVSIAIIDRPPVYVVGPVKAPGAYKYVPGMIVLQAVALAGGLDRGETSLSSAIDGVREMERFQTTSDRIQRLFARRARLEAQRNGLTSVPFPLHLAKLDRDSGITAFLSMENTLLRVESSKRQEREQALTAKVAAASKELDALKRRLSQADVQRDMRVDRLDDLQKLKDRGIVNNNSVIALRTELADIEARREEYVVAVVQATTRLAQAEQEKAASSADQDEALAKSIAAVDQDIAEARGSLNSSEAIGILLAAHRGQAPQSYQIVRPGAEGPATIPATETAALKPGDVLKVEVGGSQSNTAAQRAPGATTSFRSRAIPIGQQSASR